MKSLFKARKHPYNYNSKKFKRRMRQIEKEEKKIRERSKIDWSKMHIKFD